MRERADLSTLQQLLEAMLHENQDITARAVTRRQGSSFRHASDLTRNTERARLLNSYKNRQAELRALSEKTNKQSRTNLTRHIGRLEEECNESKKQRDTLIASHKAMLLAVGEIGGVRAWAKFFQHHQASVDTLRQLDALPSAVVLPMAGPKRPESE